jgi:hypothetical protein
MICRCSDGKIFLQVDNIYYTYTAVLQQMVEGFMANAHI